MAVCVDDELNRFRFALNDAVGRVWPVTLQNDQTGERIRKPMFNSVTADAIGSIFRVRGEFYDGFARTVAIPRAGAIASPSLAATIAVKQLKMAKEAYEAADNDR